MYILTCIYICYVNHLPVWYTWNPNDPCFGWNVRCFFRGNAHQKSRSFGFSVFTCWDAKPHPLGGSSQWKGSQPDPFGDVLVLTLVFFKPGIQVLPGMILQTVTLLVFFPHCLRKILGSQPKPSLGGGNSKIFVLFSSRNLGKIPHFDSYFFKWAETTN